MKTINKGLSIALALLFISLSFTPSINAKISKESVVNDTVEYSVEVYGMSGVKSMTISLTKKEAVQVEKLFDDIESRLNYAKDYNEIIRIYNESIIELDKYGMLGDLTVKQAQKLVTNGLNSQSNLNYLKEIENKNLNRYGYTNWFSFIWGTYYFWGPKSILPVWRLINGLLVSIELLFIEFINIFHNEDFPINLLVIPLGILGYIYLLFIILFIFLTIFIPIGIYIIQLYDVNINTFGINGFIKFESEYLYLLPFIGLIYRPLKLIEDKEYFHLLGYAGLVFGY